MNLNKYSKKLKYYKKKGGFLNSPVKEDKKKGFKI